MSRRPMRSSASAWLPTTTSNLLLLDNSAWSRLLSGRVPADRAESVIEWIGDQRLAVCLPFLLEAGYSARSAADLKAMMARLEQLPRVVVDGEVERLVLSAQRQLAERIVRPADVEEVARHLAGCRLEARWTQERARAWWEENLGPAADDLRVARHGAS